MFSENLRLKRIQNGFTQSQMADLIKVKRLTYSRYESGSREPRISKLPEIAIALSCTIDDLFCDEIAIAKASAQTLLNAQQIETQHGDDTPPWEAPVRDLDDILE